jgi:hypothetical protein
MVPGQLWRLHGTCFFKKQEEGAKETARGKDVNPGVGDSSSQPFPEGWWLHQELTFSDIRVNVLQGWPVAAFGFFQDLNYLVHFGSV